MVTAGTEGSVADVALERLRRGHGAAYRSVDALGCEVEQVVDTLRRGVHAF
jgi:hypothetical protein